jgi:Uncharacterised protein family (UPF0156).
MNMKSKAILSTLESPEEKLQKLRFALIVGQESGEAQPLDIDAVKRKAKERYKVQTK